MPFAGEYMQAPIRVGTSGCVNSWCLATARNATESGVARSPTKRLLSPSTQGIGISGVTASFTFQQHDGILREALAKGIEIPGIIRSPLSPNLPASLKLRAPNTRR